MLLMVPKEFNFCLNFLQLLQNLNKTIGLLSWLLYLFDFIDFCLYLNYISIYRFDFDLNFLLDVLEKSEDLILDDLSNKFLLTKDRWVAKRGSGAAELIGHNSVVFKIAINSNSDLYYTIKITDQVNIFCWR